MARGTFANTRIMNKLSPEVGPKTLFYEDSPQFLMLLKDIRQKESI